MSVPLRHRSIAGFTTCLLTLVVCLAAQQPPAPKPRLIPFSQVLQSNGITTRQGVIQALADKDPMIRGVAAYSLAQDHDPQAVELLSNALKSEKDEIVRVDLASSLWYVGVPDGQVQLEDTCESSSVKREVLIRATLQLSLRGKGGRCFSNLATFYQRAENSNERMELLTYLSGVCHDAPVGATDTVVAVAGDALSDTNSGVRLEAVELLAKVGTPLARQTISDAIDREADPTVKYRLRRAIERIDKPKSLPH